MSFFEQVYELVRQIPKGKVTTYGEIARALHRPHSAKAVGYALHGNRNPDEIPCYRVVNRFGETAKAFAFGGADVQRAMLEADGIQFVDGKIDLSKYMFVFS